MLTARFLLKLSTYSHKIANKCPLFLKGKLDKLTIWFALKAVNRIISRVDGRIDHTIDKVGCVGRCSCKKVA